MKIQLQLIRKCSGVQKFLPCTRISQKNLSLNSISIFIVANSALNLIITSILSFDTEAQDSYIRKTNQTIFGHFWANNSTSSLTLESCERAHHLCGSQRRSSNIFMAIGLHHADMIDKSPQKSQNRPKTAYFSKPRGKS